MLIIYLQNSSLEFKLHRLAYINLVSEGPHSVPQAIEYARVHFTPFVYQHEKGRLNFVLSKFDICIFLQSDRCG